MIPHDTTFRVRLDSRLRDRRGGRLVKKIVLTAVAALVVLFVVLVVRTVLHRPPAHEAVAAVTVPVDVDIIARHLSQAIQFKTVSNEAPLPIDQTQFEGFIDWVKSTSWVSITESDFPKGTVPIVTAAGSPAW